MNFFKKAGLVILVLFLDIILSYILFFHVLIDALDQHRTGPGSVMDGMGEALLAIFIVLNFAVAFPLVCLLIYKAKKKRTKLEKNEIKND